MLIENVLLSKILAGTGIGLFIAAAAFVLWFIARAYSNERKANSKAVALIVDDWPDPRLKAVRLIPKLDRGE